MFYHIVANFLSRASWGSTSRQFLKEKNIGKGGVLKWTGRLQELTEHCELLKNLSW